ncbi:MAG: hypothetical protein WCO91_02290 [Gemmataceae bacterium]|nr:hypothetical protein [Planctomycetota bacterium]
MSKRPPKTTVVAFKVEPALADLLNKLPNKSAFIRKAIESMLGVSCPLCQGKGVIPQGVHNHFAPLIQEAKITECQSCGDKVEMPLEEGGLDHLSRNRLEQFFLGGPLYCDPCFEKSPSCGDCGMHINPNEAVEHQHKAHPVG